MTEFYISVDVQGTWAEREAAKPHVQEATRLALRYLARAYADHQPPLTAHIAGRTLTQEELVRDTPNPTTLDRTSPYFVPRDAPERGDPL